MSTFVDSAITCPCGTELEIVLARGIHGSRLPGIRQQILSGDFHRFVCDSCGRPSIVEVEIIYTDFERGHYIAVELPDANAEAAVVKHQGIFDRTVGPVASILTTPMSMRVVSGRDGLREALLLLEQGYDTSVIAELKRDVLGSTTLCGPLMVEAAAADGFVLRSADGVRWPIERSVYDATADRCLTRAARRTPLATTPRR